MEQPVARRARWIGALLPVCVAVWLYVPAVSGALLSDDLLLRAYVVDGASGAAAWRRVGEDLTGPWLFGEPFLYRPLVTLTYVLEYWLFGGGEHVPHVTNLALFAACVFGVARLGDRLGGPRAGFVAGLLLAVHPIAHETICWPCARADLLLVCAASMAGNGLLRQRREGGCWPRARLVIACVLALASKESALVLAPLLLAVDLAAGGRPGSAAAGARGRRAALHVALLPLWGGYLWWRSHLGVLPSFADVSGLDWSRWLPAQFERLLHVVAPGVTASSAYTVGALAALVVVTAAVTAGARRWLSLGVAWYVLASLPTSFNAVFANLHNGRFLLLAWVGLALGAGVVASLPRARWLVWVSGALLALASIDMASAGRTLQADYERQWRRMRALQEQVVANGAQATVEAPLVALSFHLGNDLRLPFVDAERAYSLAVPPAVRAPIPFVALGSVLDANAGPLLMQGDVTSWRVMWQHGASLAYWLGRDGGGELVRVDRSVPAPASFAREGAAFVPAGGPASPWAIGGFEVVAAAPFSGGRVEWQAGTGFSDAFRVGASTAAGGEHRCRIDVGTDGPFLVFGTLGGIVRVAVELEGPERPRALQLVALPPVGLAPLQRELRDAPLPLGSIATGLPWHSLPANAEPGSASVVLMNRSFGWRLARPTAGLELPPAVAVRLSQSQRIGGDDRVYYFLECRVDGRPWRSQVDWFRDAR